MRGQRSIFFRNRQFLKLTSPYIKALTVSEQNLHHRVLRSILSRMAMKCIFQVLIQIDSWLKVLLHFFYSIQLMTQAKSIWFWVDSWFDSESYPCLQATPLNQRTLDYPLYDSFPSEIILNPCSAGVSSRTHRVEGDVTPPLLIHEPAAVARWARRQSKALNKYLLKNSQNFLKKVTNKVKSSQRIKSSFAWSAPEMGLTIAANPNFAKNLLRWWIR